MLKQAESRRTITKNSNNTTNKIHTQVDRQLFVFDKQLIEITSVLPVI